MTIPVLAKEFCPGCEGKGEDTGRERWSVKTGRFHIYRCKRCQREFFVKFRPDEKGPYRIGETK